MAAGKYGTLLLCGNFRDLLLIFLKRCLEHTLRVYGTGFGSHQPWISFYIFNIHCLSVNRHYYCILPGNTIAEYTNDDNGYTVVFAQVGDAFLFGPHKAKVTLKDARGRKVASAVTTIYNDGAYLRQWNADVVWEADCARITIRGAEQEDEVIELYYKRQ